MSSRSEVDAALERLRTNLYGVVDSINPVLLVADLHEAASAYLAERDPTPITGDGLVERWGAVAEEIGDETCYRIGDWWVYRIGRHGLTRWRPKAYHADISTLGDVATLLRLAESQP